MPAAKEIRALTETAGRMGKDKLRKFAENATFRCMVQPSLDQVLHRDHPLKGRWAADFFHNEHPIVLELGCGKGDYTVALAQRHPDINYIGIDIKGARMWKGAKFAEQQGLANVAFLRTRIEFIGSLFGEDEVSEIWITFADPQIGREKKRLTSPLFLARYAAFLRPDGKVRLKTDSRYLYEYTRALCEANSLPVAFSTHDLYALEPSRPAVPQTAAAGPVPADGGLSAPAPVTPLDPALFEVQTFYEKHFLAQGYPICYLEFSLKADDTSVLDTETSTSFLSPQWEEERWKDEAHHAFVIQVYD